MEVGASAAWETPVNDQSEQSIDLFWYRILSFRNIDQESMLVNEYTMEGGLSLKSLSDLLVIETTRDSDSSETCKIPLNMYRMIHLIVMNDQSFDT